MLEDNLKMKQRRPQLGAVNTNMILPVKARRLGICHMSLGRRPNPMTLNHPLMRPSIRVNGSREISRSMDLQLLLCLGIYMILEYKDMSITII